MPLSRRQYLAGSAAMIGAGAWAAPASNPADKTSRPKIGMCDWSLGDMTPAAFELAKKTGLDGLQISIGWEKDKLWLRRPEVRRQYLDASRRTGVRIASLAMGVLNLVPLHTEPRAALWIADAIDLAGELGVTNILLAFFGPNELRKDNRDDMRRVIEALQELAPRAEKAGVVLGIETYLDIDGHLQILDAVKSKAVQVYYDFYNSGATKGYDVPEEIKQLGRDRICEIHFKEGPEYLGSGKVDWPAVAEALKAISYDGWYVLETTSPGGDVVADTQRNIRFVRDLLTP